MRKRVLVEVCQPWAVHAKAGVSEQEDLRDTCCYFVEVA